MPVRMVMAVTVRMIVIVRMRTCVIVRMRSRRDAAVFVVVRGFFHVLIPYCPWRLLQAKVVLSDYSCNWS